MRSLALASLVVALSAAACGATPEAPSGDDETRALGTPLDARPGDRVELERVAVIAPQPGLGVWAEIVLEDGATQTLRVETRPDSVVWLLPASDEADETDQGAAEAGDGPSGSDAQAAGEATASGSIGPCKDGAKHLSPYSWNTTFEWSFNAGTTPSGLSKDAVEAVLRKATNNITMSRNSCGLADQVSATHSYKGRTSIGTQVTADASCKDGNGVNTVGFGDLPDGILGLTCVWYDGEGHALESDMRLNKGDYKWTPKVDSSCNNRWSIEAVATHERGHTFGLDHVAEGAHGNLTMSPALNGPCQNSESTLGLGDVKALRVRY